MKNIKRICIYGGPGSGKSTLAAEMYSLLKKKKRSVELVREWVKNWAYQNKNIKSFDQVLIFANQLHQEDMLLNNGCDLVVTDCPIELTCYYTDYNQLEGFTGIVNVATEFNKKYPATRILVQREGNFSPIGRYQGEEESKKIDRDIISFVSTFFGQEIKEMTYNQALNYVKENF